MQIGFVAAKSERMLERLKQQQQGPINVQVTHPDQRLLPGPTETFIIQIQLGQSIDSITYNCNSHLISRKYQ